MCHLSVRMDCNGHNNGHKWHNGGVAVLNSDRTASSVWGAISRNGGPSVSNIDY